MTDTSNHNGGGIDQSFAAALRAAEGSPESDAAWNHVEELAEELQRTDEVAALYRAVLEKPLDPDVRTQAAERAVQFHDEWFGDSPETITGLLSRIIELDPGADWAFERLTVMLTGAEQWDELLSVYDRALAATQDPDARRQLLDDAAQVAKDFADQPGRAADYLQRLVEIDPDNEQLVTSLERLLDKQDRHRDLIELWQSRIAELPSDEAKETRLRIATYWLEQLGEPERAVDELRQVLADSPGAAEACALLEQVLESSDASAETRRAALSLLRKNYLVAERPEDVVRVLQRALELTEPEERRPLHRECGSRLAILGRDTEAMEQYAELLRGDPTDPDARKQIRQLAARSDRHDLHAEALIAAAEACDEESQRVAVLAEAALLYRTELGDSARAIELYGSVLGSGEAEPQVALAAAHALNELLAADDQAEERLVVLEKLAELEQTAAVRRSMLAEAARLADKLGDPHRALANWKPVLDANGQDVEALTAVVDLLERNERWHDLVTALRRRAEAPVLPLQRRTDLVRIAQVQAEQLEEPAEAIESWLQIRAEFGENAEVIAALDELMGQQGRWRELVTLLADASQRERGRISILLTRVADIYRLELDDSGAACTWYARALGVDPHSEDARTGLESLLEDGPTVADAAEALAEAYALTDDWQRSVALLEPRLQAADSDRARAKLLFEAATLMAERGDDPDGALQALARALPLDPADVTLESRMLWLAKSTGGWATAARALQEAAAASEVTERSAQLRAAEAHIHDEELGDTATALAAYQDALTSDPRNLKLMKAVVECAAKSQQWAVAARTVAAVMQTADRYEPELVAVLDEHATTPDAYAELARGIDEAVAARAEGAAGSAPLDRTIAQRLEMTAARWLRDECQDLDSATEAASRAVAFDPSRLEALELLASLQRGEPGAGLVETLLRIDERSPRSLDALREAAEVALDASEDAAQPLTILEALYRKAGNLWTGQDEDAVEGERSPAEVADWALDKLVARHIVAGNADQAVQALRDAARLPLDPATTGALRAQAAEMLAERGDRAQAIDLYRRVLEAAPDDVATIQKIAELSEEDDRISEALAMRLRELELTTDRQPRLALRLQNSRLTGLLEERGGRVEALLANLAEEPGHPESIEALATILAGRGRHRELAETLQQQAAALESAGDTTRAADLYGRAAALAEEPLGDLELAIECHTKVVDLDGANTVSLSALARLNLQRDEPAQAAKWLRKRLDTATDKERVAVLLQLARARIKAEKEETAIQALQTAFDEAPRNAEVRKLLFRLYRSGKNWTALATALSRAAEHVADESTVLAYSREAAEIYHDKLGAPADAVPALRRAVPLAPDDRQLSAMLAEGLRLSGELTEARDLLSGLIEGYGRRRSTGRAALHLELARVLRAQGEMERAIEELDKASKMDAGNVVILHTLAELARENDELDRAERAYRTLLLKVRRTTTAREAEVPIGAPEVLLELSRISAARGQQNKADELLESAMEALSQNDTEAPRLQAKLREQEEFELLHRVLEARLGLKQPPRRRAAILAEKAEVLETALDRPEEALEARLAAIKCNPASPVHHQAAWDVAERLAKLDRYVDEVESLLADTSDDRPHVRCELLLRLGEVYEKARNDLDRAATYYQQAEATGVRQVDVWRAEARLAGARGDEPEQLRLLNQLASLGEDQAETRASALYRMAEVQLASTETLAEGIDSLRKAMEDDPRMERAGMILRRAVDEHPAEAELLDIYARVARETDNEELLLHYLERRTHHDTGTPEHARQATDLALKLEQPERAEQLMLRAAEIGRALAEQGGLERVAWALLGLAEIRMEAGDLAGAVDWLSEAVGVAEDAEVFARSRRVAELAAHPEGDLTLAAKLYERLLERDPTEREAWEPLADLYDKLGDIDGLERIVGETLDGIQDPQDRNALRVMLAKALLKSPARADEAITVLNDVLVEDPVHDEAQTLLAGFLEHHGRTEELIALLRRQLQVALERGEQEAIQAAALRLGERLAGDEGRAEAVGVYQAALEHGDDPELLRALLKRLGEEHDRAERASLLERLLAVDEGPGAGALALDLAALYESLDDGEATLRVLRLGYERAPANDALREALEQRYRDRGDFDGLARTLVDAAERQVEPAGQVAMLREAATVYRDKLSDPASAAQLLRRASDVAPDDSGLAIELANTLAAAGDQPGAVELLSQRLDQTEADDVRLELLLARAELHAMADEEAGLLHDLDAAFAIDGARVAPMLEGALQNARVRAAERGDREAERSLTLRCVDVMMVQDKRETVSLLLAEWTDRTPDDLEALRLRRDIDAVDERWESVADTCERLIDLEREAAQIDAALSLAHAYRELGAPERSQPGLERARLAQPDNPQLRGEVKKLYQQIGAERELTQLVLEEAAAEEDGERKRSLLRQAGETLVSIGDAASAVPALREALELKPGDAETVAALADAYTLAGWFDDADEVLDQAIEATKGRRTPELCLLLYRKSELARAQGNQQRELELLQEAHTCNKKNGQVAAALADLAEELGQYDLATKTLRTISLIDTECPISRAEAFLRQGRIAERQGDTKNALMWARRAKREDPDSEEIAQFLASLS